VSIRQRYVVDLICDGCGKVKLLYASSAADARKKAPGWKTGRRKHDVYDACEKCPLPEGYRKT